MDDLKGKIALVTGGARGIGKAVAEALADQGCDIAIADLDFDNAQSTAKSLAEKGIKTLPVKVNVSSAKDVEAMVNQVMETFSRIDVLVNNAGITRDTLLMRMEEKDWDQVILVNLKSAYLCTRQVIRIMMKQRSGKIINMASVVGVMGNAGQSNYSASKAGLIGFTKSIAKEVATRNIQVNAIAPGFIETEMTASLSDDVRNSYLESIPAKRMGSPDDVAHLTAFLASAKADYITGQVIHVDGGLVM